MRVIFMGTPEFSVGTLNAIVEAGHQVVAAYSQPPRKSGRGQKPRPSPVHARAEALGIEVRTPVNFKTADAIQDFADLNADVAVVVAYGLILPQALLDAPRYGCLNVHASLLPRWRGAAPIHRAIEAGDAETGVCIMQMQAGLDTGPVITSVATPIGARETTGELHDRLALLGATALVSVINHAPEGDGAGWASSVQPDDGVTYAEKIDKAECPIDWSEPAENLVRKINAFSPFPGAFCTHQDIRLKLLQAELGPAEERSEAEPGTVLSEALDIACGTGSLRVLRAQRPGKGPMDTAEFLRGNALPPGTVLE